MSKFIIEEDDMIDEPKQIKSQKQTIKNQTEKPTEEPKKVGRTKTKVEGTKTVNIAIAPDTLEKINVAKICYHNNMTEYINTLIQRDLEQNFKEYQTIVNTLNRFK